METTLSWVHKMPTNTIHRAWRTARNLHWVRGLLPSNKHTWVLHFLEKVPPLRDGRVRFSRCYPQTRAARVQKTWHTDATGANAAPPNKNGYARRNAAHTNQWSKTWWHDPAANKWNCKGVAQGKTNVQSNVSFQRARSHQRLDFQVKIIMRSSRIEYIFRKFNFYMNCTFYVPPEQTIYLYIYRK